MSNVFSKPEEDLNYWSLTPKLHTVVIELFMVKALRLRGNPWRPYRAKYLPSRNWTCGDKGFTVTKLAILGAIHLLKMRICNFLNHY